MFPASSKNVFHNVPYDILREIFLHCLPENPLVEVQPNIEIAPMLLCRISSSWRAVALSIPSLWAQLYTLLPIEWNSDGNPITWSVDALARNIEFMRWWMANHHSLAPSLRLDIYRRSTEEEDYSPSIYLLVERDISSFLIAYMYSAQYLEVGVFYTYLTRQSGLSPPIPSNLHTLVLSANKLYHVDEFSNAYGQIDTVLPPYIPSTLQRLAILAPKISTNYTRGLKIWSTLTHLHLNPVNLFDVRHWLSIIRELVNLQWGDFSVFVVGAHVDYLEPQKFSLSSLTTLTVSCWSNTDFPLTMLFKHLELPSLRNLYLSSSATTWRDFRAVTEVHNVLSSAPKIRKLSLGTRNGEGFLCFPYGRIPSEIRENIPSLSTYAPHLSHLQVDLRCTNYSYLSAVSRGFTDEFLVFNRWLDIENITNPIQKITIVTYNGADGRQWKDKFRGLLIQDITDRVTRETDISFEIVSGDDEGVGLSESVWRTW